MDDPRVTAATPPELVTARDVAERLSVTPAWVLAEARARRLPCFRLGRQVRFAWPDVEKYLESHLVPTINPSTSRDLRVKGPKAGVSGTDFQAVSNRGPAVALPGKLFPAGKQARTS